MAPPKPTLQVSTAITTTDHGQIVVLAGWLCLAIGTSLSMARIYIRWPLNVLAGKDDIAYSVSVLFAFVQTAVIIDAVRRGFGRVAPELEDWQVVRISKVSTISVCILKNALQEVKDCLVGSDLDTTEH